MQSLTGKELTTALITLVLFLFLLLPGGQRILRAAGSPFQKILLPPTTSVSPLGDTLESNVVRFTSEPYQRNILVRTFEKTYTVGTTVTSDGALVGIVKESNPPYTTVQLVSDQQFRGVAETKDQTKGVIEGELNAIRLSRVPKNEKLQVGDELVTSGLDGRFESGIPIGVIREVFDESSLLKSAYVETYANLAELKNVEFSND